MDRKTFAQRAVHVVVMLLLVAGLAFGQGIVTGSISGTVLDQQGAVLADAAVRATQIETNRVFTTTSSKAGVVQLPSLPPGTYNVTVETKGFNQRGEEVCFFRRKVMVWKRESAPVRRRPYGDDVWD